MKRHLEQINNINSKIRYFGFFSISKSFPTFGFGLKLLFKTFWEMQKYHV
jgi:hypothetical protein